MPWMLLNEPRRPPHAKPGEGDAAAEEHGATRRGGSVWIVIGGLERALVQAGMIGRLLEAGPRPASIIASGFGVANALLIAGARRETFERRWEHLRASRFLVSAAFGSVRWFGALNGMFEDLAALLAEIAQVKQTRADAGPEILTATEEGFSMLPRDSTASTWRAAVKQSLRYTTESAPLVAGAIREAATHGGGPVLVLGLERTTQNHPDVDAACRAAAAGGVRVTFVTAAAPRRSGLLDYLLPGSGVPERLMHEGRSAADHWMGNAGRNGSSRSGQAPAGVLGGGGEPLPEPEGIRGLWTSDASEASNWPK